MKSSKDSKTSNAHNNRKFKNHYRLLQAVGAIEINSTQAAAVSPCHMATQRTQTLDVRFLCAALEYPYMFKNPIGDLRIAKEWSVAFTITCMEIDALLGVNKRGFCWRQLDVVEPDHWVIDPVWKGSTLQPLWYWSLDKAYDHKVVVEVGAKGPQARIVSSNADPEDELRNAIRCVVENGMRRVLTFNVGVSNAGELQ
jgi:hypothetical protein